MLLFIVGGNLRSEVSHYGDIRGRGEMVFKGAPCSLPPPLSTSKACISVCRSFLRKDTCPIAPALPPKPYWTSRHSNIQSEPSFTGAAPRVPNRRYYECKERRPGWATRFQQHETKSGILSPQRLSAFNKRLLLWIMCAFGNTCTITKFVVKKDYFALLKSLQLRWH